MELHANVSLKWAVRLKARFTGSFLFAVGDFIVLKLVRDAGIREIEAYSINGELTWSRRCEPGTGECLFPIGDRLYTDGDRARSLSMADGRTLAERDFAMPVVARGSSYGKYPLYWRGVGDAIEAIMELERDTLALRWEWTTDPSRHMVAGDVLCGFLSDGGIHLVNTRTWSEVRIAPSVLPNVRGDQTAHGIGSPYWCVFAETERMAFDMANERIAWRLSESLHGAHRLLWRTVECR